MTTLSNARAVSLAAVVAFSGVGVASAQTFDLVGYLGIGSKCHGVSADGSFAVGNHFGPGFTWNRQGGRYDFGLGSDIHASTAAFGISGDGRVVVGDGSQNGATRAFRWSGPGTYQTLGTIGLWPESRAAGTNQDGSVVVGRAVDHVSGSGQAFRWTEARGMQGLGWTRPNDAFYSEANAISRDGTTIVGTSSGSVTDAFAWTEDGGMRILPLSSGALSAQAYAANYNGSIIVGQSGYTAAAWRDGTVLDLGAAPGASQSIARGVSDDGNVIVGSSSLDSGDGNVASLWTPASGMVSLVDYLRLNAVEIPMGWTLSECMGVSSDGRTFVGRALRTSDRLSVGFVATVPAPTVVSAFLIAGACTFNRRRR